MILQINMIINIMNKDMNLFKFNKGQFMNKGRIIWHLRGVNDIF